MTLETIVWTQEMKAGKTGTSRKYIYRQNAEMSTLCRRILCNVKMSVYKESWCETTTHICNKRQIQRLLSAILSPSDSEALMLAMGLEG